MKSLLLSKIFAVEKANSFSEKADVGGFVKDRNLRGGVNSAPPVVDNRRIAKVIEDYDAESHREISFKVGDEIRLVFYHKSVDW